MITKASVFNTVVTANTDILPSDLSPTRNPATFRIYACFSVGGVLTVRRTRGGVTVSEQLNSGTALAANSAYMFDIIVEIIVEAGDTINIQYSVNATCICLKIVEIGIMIG